MRRGFAAAVVALLLRAAVLAQAPPRVAAPRVSSTVDRTAMWVADRVAFTIEIDCDPGVDVLLDDVAKEKLRLNGLEALSSEVTTSADAADRKTYRIRYLLTTYRVDTPSPSIEPLSVRYYARRPGERFQDVAPAGDVQVPGAILALRSTLPENQADLAIRDGRGPLPRPALFGHASQIGLALIVVSLAPALVLAFGAVRRRTAARPARRSARQSKQDQRATLERLRAIDVGSEADRRRACDEVSAAVRDHVAARAHLPAPALTPAEIDARLAAAGGRMPREAVVALLTACDEARYRPPSAGLSADACRDALASAEQILTGR